MQQLTLLWPDDLPVEDQGKVRGTEMNLEDWKRHAEAILEGIEHIHGAFSPAVKATLQLLVIQAKTIDEIRGVVSCFVDLLTPAHPTKPLTMSHEMNGRPKRDNTSAP